MSARVAVLVPVLARPHRVKPLVESLAASATVIPCDPIFLCSPDDPAELDAVNAAAAHMHVVSRKAGCGDYPRKINVGFERYRGSYLFFLFGADDLVFHPGWVERAVAKWHETGACVIGTNDGGNRRVMAGTHSTHPLVHRDYWACGAVDQKKKLLHEGYDHNFCNPPETPIWMANLSFKPLRDVRPGDAVMGWSRVQTGSHTMNKLRPSIVAHRQGRIAPLVHVRMASGRSFRCTADHNWLNAAWSPASSHSREWVTPEPGRTLLHVVDTYQPPIPAELERTAGWLAGIYDGEGSGVYIATQSADKNPEVVAAISDALTRLGIRFRTTARPSRIVEFYLNGGRREFLAFLLRVQPVRRDALVQKIVGRTRFGMRDKIVEVLPDGEGEVISLTTQTGNYVAWGFASKNCDDEFVQTAQWRGTYEAALDSRVEHLHPDWGKGVMDETYRKGKAGMESDRALYESRKKLWGKR